MGETVECVPNISEGRDKKKINAITSVVERNGVKLLDVSSDKNHNRTVVTFAGRPRAVKAAAFDLIKEASELIDMRNHKGAHPRLGAVDVCPFVPVSGVTIKACVKLAHELGREVGKKLGLSGYFYEAAATSSERKNLADIRKGEYEALPRKLKRKEWKPDFGPVKFNPKFGAVVIGARGFLVAYNVNLKTTDFKLARDIARIIRHSGDTKIPGVFETVKAIGVDMSDKGYVQVSMNLTDYRVDSIPVVFEAIKRMAKLAGVEIRSTEVIGFIPKETKEVLGL